METQQLLDGMHYVNLINTTGSTFLAHGSLHPQLRSTCLGCRHSLCTSVNYIFYSPYLMLLTYEFPNYIATQKKPS
jgi:hypothetical protein